MNNRIPGILALSLCAAISVRPAFADDLAEMRKLHQSTVDMVNQMLAQGLITRERADQILRQAQQTAGPWAGGSGVAAPPAASSAADVTPGAAAAEAPPAAPSTNDLLKALVESGAISKEKAFELQHDAQQKAAMEIPATVSPEATPEQKAAAAAAPVPKPGDKSTVRVPYVPEIIKQQIRDQVKEEVLNQARRERWGDPGALPAWITRLTWNGEVRLRYETDMFPTDGAPNVRADVASALPPYYYNLNDTQETRNRIRVRVRLGVESQIDDHWSAGIRLASGGSGGGSNPSNESQTLGDYDERFAIGLDRAYLRYKPFNWFSATAGRFGNPFYTPTDLVWAEAVSFDGLVTKFSGELNDKLDGALVTGAFPLLQEDNQSITPPGTKAFSRWLFGYQAGLHWQFAQREDLKLALAFYDFHRVEGIAAPTGGGIGFDYDSTAAPFRQKGNQVFDIDALNDNNSSAPTNLGLLSQFRELNVSGAVDLADYAPTHVILTGDFVRNLGFHAGEIESRTFITDPSELKARVEGYQFRLQVGADKITNHGQWYGYAGYRHLERDAVIDAFTDVDFWLGGTNTKGYFVGGRYGVAKNTSVGARWMSGNAIDGPPLAIDILQLELLASF